MLEQGHHSRYSFSHLMEMTLIYTQAGHRIRQIGSGLALVCILAVFQEKVYQIWLVFFFPHSFSRTCFYLPALDQQPSICFLKTHPSPSLVKKQQTSRLTLLSCNVNYKQCPDPAFYWDKSKKLWIMICTTWEMLQKEESNGTVAVARKYCRNEHI